MELSEHDQEVVDIARKALETNLLLQFEYDGQPRLVEVHAVGISTAGRPCIRAFQISGGSNSGEVETWKLFSARKFEFPKIISIQSLAPRDGYNQGDKAMVEIISEFK